jgi:pimeloyl-ACP methyl ester carboxylesterase
MKRILAKLPVLALVVSPVCSTPAAIEQREHRYGTYQLYIPETRSTESNIVVVVHGTPQPDQDAADLARRFISRWTDFADQTGSVVVAPAFDQENFASCDSGCGGRGGYRGLFGRIVGADDFLHEILDEVALEAPTSEHRFYLYGHSAGGQFANRYVARHPNRLLGVVLSAPGRYAFPEPTAAWHYGMRRWEGRIGWPGNESTHVVVEPDPGGWVRAAALPVQIVIGDRDTVSQPCQPAHCAVGDTADTRIAIGARWMSAMNGLAMSNGTPARVRKEIIPDVDHNSERLTPASQEALRHMMAGRVNIPDVVGMSANRAISMLEAVGLAAGTGQPIASDRPEGTVVVQSPEAGSWVEPGRRVVVSPSLGEPPPQDRVTVPDVVGRTSIQARSMIRAAGFTPSPTVVDSDRPFDEVVEQIPAAGSRAVPGSEVRIFISRGSGPPPRR